MEIDYNTLGFIIGIVSFVFSLVKSRLTIQKFSETMLNTIRKYKTVAQTAVLVPIFGRIADSLTTTVKLLFSEGISEEDLQDATELSEACYKVMAKVKRRYELSKSLTTIPSKE